MNSLVYGKRRDEEVISLVSKGGAFTSKQIQRLIFSNRKSGDRICRRCLSRLSERKQIKKWERSPQEPSIYYLRKPRQLDHVLLINDVYCSLMTQKKSWYHVDFRWHYPILGGKVIADAMAIIYTQPDRKGKQVVFIEVERFPSKRFNKPEIYKKIFDDKWEHEEWCVTTDKKYIFPTILIVTEENLRLQSPLRFKIATLNEVKKDIYSIILRRD